MLFHIFDPFAITITYFSLPSKTNKQEMSFAFKMSPLFHFDLVPFGYKPLAPGQVVRLLCIALAREGMWDCSSGSLLGPAFLQSALYVSATSCPAFPPPDRAGPREAPSLSPATKALSAAPPPGPTTTSPKTGWEGRSS